MSNDDPAIILANQTLVATKPYVTRKVLLQTIEDVKNGDFDQATKVMEAWRELGWEAGGAIARALNEGHGYSIKEMEMIEKFHQRINSLVSDSGISSDALFSYSVSSQTSKQLAAPDLQGKEIVVQTLGVIQVDEKPPETIINATAILRQKLPVLPEEKKTLPAVDIDSTLR
jgi:hypothetical protein